MTLDEHIESLKKPVMDYLRLTGRLKKKHIAELFERESKVLFFHEVEESFYSSSYLIIFELYKKLYQYTDWDDAQLFCEFNPKQWEQNFLGKDAFYRQYCSRKQVKFIEHLCLDHMKNTYV